MVHVFLSAPKRNANPALQALRESSKTTLAPNCIGRLRQFEVSEGAGLEIEGRDRAASGAFQTDFRKQARNPAWKAFIVSIVFLQLQEVRKRPRKNCRKPVCECIDSSVKFMITNHILAAIQWGLTAMSSVFQGFP
jgi:hypothetical protein